MENIKQDDVKDEAEEKNLKAELHDLEEAPQYQTSRIDQESIKKSTLKLHQDSEANMLIEESAAAKGKLNPINPKRTGVFLGQSWTGGGIWPTPGISALRHLRSWC